MLWLVHFIMFNAKLVHEEEIQEAAQEFEYGGLSVVTKGKVQHSKVFGPMSEIEPGLYLGTAYNAYDRKEIEAKNITNIINVSESEMSYGHDGVRVHYQRLRYRSDSQYEAFLELCKLIESILKAGESVLVHCVRGRSRSVGLVMCYLVYSRNFTSKQALDHIRMRRTCVDPIASIQEQAASFAAQYTASPISGT